MENPELKNLRTKLFLKESDEKLKKRKRRIRLDQMKKRVRFEGNQIVFRSHKDIQLTDNIKENDDLFNEIKELFSRVAVLLYFDKKKNVPVMKYMINNKKLFLQYEEEEKQFYLINHNKMLPLTWLVNDLKEDRKHITNLMGIGEYAKMYRKDLLELFKFGW